jgi:hypothetical protein
MKTDPNCTASLEPSANAADFAATDKDFERMMQMLTGFFVTQTASAVATYSIAEHLAKGPATAQQIATIEGIDSTATFRLLRACASPGLVTCEGWADVQRDSAVRYVAVQRARFAT